MKFEWDSNKAISNIQKHGVSFSEAATVFSDPLSQTFADIDHSLNENRYIIIGLSSKGNVLVISHTDRGEFIRIINARKATRQERRFYEQQQ